jgi:hypothetical protein
MEGASKEGVGGFLTGMGRGIVGYVLDSGTSNCLIELMRSYVYRMVTKPVVGMFDLANNVSQGVRNTTTIFDANDIDRLRLPRYIAGDGILRVSILISPCYISILDGNVNQHPPVAIFSTGSFGSKLAKGLGKWKVLQ